MIPYLQFIQLLIPYSTFLPPPPPPFYPSSSSQQYLVTKIQSPLLLPVDENERIPDHIAHKRAKGIKRQYHSLVTTDLFIDTCVNNLQSERKEIFAFKKFFFNVFLNKTRKVLLTRANTKRNFYLPMQKDGDSYFSFPLFVKHLSNDQDK